MSGRHCKFCCCTQTFIKEWGYKSFIYDLLYLLACCEVMRIGINIIYFAVPHEMTSLIFAKIKKMSYNLSFAVDLIGFLRVKLVMSY